MDKPHQLKRRSVLLVLAAAPLAPASVRAQVVAQADKARATCRALGIIG